MESILKKEWNKYWKSHLIHSNINFSDEFKDFIECCYEPKFNKRIGITELLGHEWFNGKIVKNLYIAKLASKGIKN